VVTGRGDHQLLGAGPPVTCLFALETPALAVDLDRVERNIRSLQAYTTSHGLALRPHVKTHKMPQIARMQLDAGAVGIACQKLGEAEVMVEAGIQDILLTYPLIGTGKPERLAALARRARLAVFVDSPAVAEGLSHALDDAGTSVDVLIDCDTGFGRTGTQSPGDAATLGLHVATMPALRLRGLATFPTTRASGPWLRDARRACEEHGLSIDWVSGGGTPGARATHEIEEVTELRAGTYVFGDRACVADGSVPVDDCALHVVATVVSCPTRDRVIVDAGSKTLSSDLAIGATGHGSVLEHPDAAIVALSEEHGWVDVSGCSNPPAVGQVVTILPNHACAAVNLADELIVHRSGVVQDTWRIAARGRSR
jgi:D-serine deaminase-like pyridoxal phosphate-dependent protein